jgi:hypothetical protein
VKAFSYAGLQSDEAAAGIAARLDAAAAPSVSGGHVGGWVGVGGTGAGPGGATEWLQAGLAAFPGDETMQMYYEVTVPGSAPRYVELDAGVATGVSHDFAVLEMQQRPSWWRVWVDGRAASPPIHLPGSHGSWHPQAVAESWNGGEGACNGYTYRFSNVDVATNGGGSWRPLHSSYEWHDPGYKVVQLSTTPRGFLATSLTA